MAEGPEGVQADSEAFEETLSALVASLFIFLTLNRINWGLQPPLLDTLDGVAMNAHHGIPS
jgi:hypothetical protein